MPSSQRQQPRSKSAAEEAKAQEAAQASSKRAKAKKGKGQITFYLTVGAGVAVCLLAIFLAVSPDGSRKGRATKWDNYVNDRGLIAEATSKSDGNFTAAASPFFNKWTLNDAKYGLAGISVSNMIGISGAVSICESDESTEGGVIPPSYDVRDNWPGCFGDVRDSGNCSSSYAIAAAEVISARFCIADNGKYAGVQLSPQQILSCDKKSRGCKGGGIDSVWSYIQRRGLYPEECVPYKAEKGQCKTDCDESKKLKVLDHCVLTREKAIKRDIYNKGPVVAPIYLKNEYLTYSSGVYTPTEGADSLFTPDDEATMHAVTLLGWGKSQGVPYWTIRHSWGSGWGEDGYARVSIGSVVRDSYVVTGTVATEEAIQAAEQKKIEDEKRKEEAKKERALRDERIREARKQREAEEASQKEQDDLNDLDDDFEAEVDLDDIDTDVDAEVS